MDGELAGRHRSIGPSTSGEDGAPLMTRVAVTRMRQGDADDDGAWLSRPAATDFYLPVCVFFTPRSARARAECGRTDGRLVGVGRGVVAAAVASWGRWLDVDVVVH